MLCCPSRIIAALCGCEVGAIVGKMMRRGFWFVFFPRVWWLFVCMSLGEMSIQILWQSWLVSLLSFLLCESQKLWGLVWKYSPVLWVTYLCISESALRHTSVFSFKQLRLICGPLCFPSQRPRFTPVFLFVVVLWNCMVHFGLFGFWFLFFLLWCG